MLGSAISGVIFGSSVISTAMSVVVKAEFAAVEMKASDAEVALKQRGRVR